MNVCFVLPPLYGLGIGGYAVVYEYAARLQDRGHRSTVLHLDPPPKNPHDLAEFLRRRRSVYLRPNPYVVRPGMTVRSVRKLRRSLVRDADALIATAWMTADPVYRARTRGQKAYFIQHYETWSGPRAEVDRTWRLPLRRIVIASWLEGVASELSAEPVHHVPNAIDGQTFHVTRPIADRDRGRVGMLFSGFDWKRSRDGISAVEEARQRGVDVTLAVFSVAERPAGIPSWVEWHSQLTPRQVMEYLNTLSIFVSPSQAEGWPLPPAEAMACGCALVSSDIGGVRDYAREGESARLYPVGDIGRLADLLIELIQDDDQRQQLARAGQRLITTDFSWNRSVDLLESVLREPRLS